MAAAIGEVLKFLPPDADALPTDTIPADAVPTDTIWSDLGRGVYEAEPGRFWRRRLDVVQRTYRKLADRFIG